MKAVELSFEIGGEFADRDAVRTAASGVVTDALESGIKGAT
ncbi:MAG TPA: hypothetical protein VKM72_26580 [Thermoanaerobaculia bacterium]|nr:hypothetical protein [Thermoanaerobaculia bacterium]